MLGRFETSSNCMVLSTFRRYRHLEIYTSTTHINCIFCLPSITRIQRAYPMRRGDCLGFHAPCTLGISLGQWKTLIRRRRLVSCKGLFFKRCISGWIPSYVAISTSGVEIMRHVACNRPCMLCILEYLSKLKARLPSLREHLAESCHGNVSIR